MRGHRGQVAFNDVVFGSIPAHAGAPDAQRLGPRAEGVHPRTCGGTTSSSCPRHFQDGPSPHMRGHQGLRCSHHSGARSIPAHAGAPHHPFFHVNLGKVHPRTCGGTLLNFGTKVAGGGPSPHMRGHHLIRLAPCGAGGSIPAHAGAPRWPPPRPSPRWVHPRTCGGTAPLRLSSPRRQGPSPHMRGHRAGIAVRGAGGGSIPAHAGAPRGAPS